MFDFIIDIQLDNNNNNINNNNNNNNNYYYYYYYYISHDLPSFFSSNLQFKLHNTNNKSIIIIIFIRIQ